MQALILFASLLAVSSASVVSLVPVSYLAAEPVPVYNQAHNTLTGEYAYSYAGGPSAKEEVKTADGVTRGAYSYVDAHGIVQSAQYVADDAGFRVAATNVPTDAQVGVNVPYETPEVRAAKAAHFAEHAKAIAALGRRRRRSVAISSQYHNRDHESIAIEEYAAAGAPVAYAAAPLVQHQISSVPTSVSRQDRFQVHRSSKLEVSGAAPVYAAENAHDAYIADNAVEVGHEFTPVQVAVHAAPPAAAVVSSVPTAVSSQSRFQVHNSQKLEVHEPVLSVAPVEVADSVAVDSFVRAAPAVAVHAAPAVAVHAAPAAVVSSVPTAVSSQSRFQIHNSQRLEVHEPVAAVVPVEVADSVAVQAVRVAPPAAVHVEAAPAAVAVASVPTAVSSQSRTQIHNGARYELHAPAYTAGAAAVTYAQPAVHLENSYVYPARNAVHAPVFAQADAVATAVSSQSRAQVHSGHRVEPWAAEPSYHSVHPVGVPQDTAEVAAAKRAHAEAYAAEVLKHQGW